MGISDRVRPIPTPIGRETNEPLEVSLTWGRTSGNSLDMHIHPPNSNSVILHDGDDGRIDGKISLRTSLTSDMTNRIWMFEVVGARVSGTESYILIINSYE